MASEILGLFTTPEQYNMMQQQGAQNRALQFAQLSPFEKANYGIYQGAGQLAGATAGLFGVQDPQLRMISQRQMLSKEIDPSDPESILRAAQKAAQLNDQPFAFSLANAARKMQSEMALAQQRGRIDVPDKIQAGREINKLVLQRENLLAQGSAATSPQVKALDAEISSLQRATKGENIPDTIQIAHELALGAGPEGSDAYMAKYRTELRTLTEKKNADKQLEQSRLLVEAGYAPGSEEYKAKMRQFVEAEITGKGKGKGTQVDIGGIRVDTGKAGEAAGKKIGEELVDVKNKQSALDSIADAKAILKQGIYAGAYGPAGKIVAKYTGIGSKDKVARTEEFVSYIGNVVIPRLKEFGGNDSEQELKYLNNVMGGNLEMEPAALSRILDRAEKNIQRGIDRLRKQAETGETKKPLTSLIPRNNENAERPSEPAMTMPTPAAPASAPAAAAPVAAAPSGAPKATKRWNPQTRKLEAIR